MLSLASGSTKRELGFCASARDSARCGPDGKHWEAR